jgi:hypothetical protein
MIVVMSFAQVLEELPRFTASQRQELLKNVLELDEQGLSLEELVMVDERLSAYSADPSRAIPAREMETKLRSRLGL